MAYILDGAVILVLILAIIIGYKRGFVKALIKLAGCIAAVVLASALSTVLAGGIFDAFIGPKLEQTLVSQIQTADSSTIVTAVEDAMDKMPGIVTNTLQSFGLGTPEQIVGSIGNAVNDSAETVADVVVTKVFRPIAVLLLRALCFFLLFAALMIVVSFVARAISHIFKLPILKQMNGIGGALVGAVEGAVLVLVAVTVVQLIATSSKPDAAITQTDVENTILVSAIANVNPITGALQSILDSLPNARSV